MAYWQLTVGKLAVEVGMLQHKFQHVTYVGYLLRLSLEVSGSFVNQVLKPAF